MSLKIRWWQLGSDQDTSFVGFPDTLLAEKLTAIRRYMERFGQEVHLGLAWHWLFPPPRGQPRPVSFTANTISPGFTADELSAYLDGRKKSQAKNWVTLRPLSRQRYSVEDRARDLVGRMLAAKIKGAGAVFIPEPFDDDRGLVHADGSPTDLFLAWRTTANLTAGTEYMGSIHMPNGSHNYIFRRGDAAVMVVWNDAETKEVMYLGENVAQINLWGHKRQLDKRPLGSIMAPKVLKERQEIKVGRLPTFLIGIDPQVAAWRMAFQFEKKQLSSVFVRRQAAAYTFKNGFNYAVSGSVRVQTPAVWDVDRPAYFFKISKGDTSREVMRILLGPNASSGPQVVQVDFEITTRKTLHFSVYRVMQVGFGDVTIDLSSKLDKNGNLIVEQTLTNKTDKEVSFNCVLLAKGRRRKRVQVFGLQRGRSTSSFILPNGEELIGKTLWVRAEEIGGGRILNYHLEAER